MVHQLFPSNSAYPSLLKSVEDKPKQLFVKGAVEVLSLPSVAVVGTRNMTSYGRYATQKFVEELVGYGFVIVSGLALGVDGQAHRTALACGGKTIAVLAHGLDRVSPVEHTTLAGDIVEAGGALISEFPKGFGAQKFSFVRRNRIIAGMAAGVLVVEAGHKSGTKITAGLAAEYGRPVFAVPGPITSQFSEGTKDLVNLGAKLVTSAEDMIEELRLPVAATLDNTSIGQTHLFDTPTEQHLFETIRRESGSATLNTLATGLGERVEVIQQLLLSLEMKGYIHRVGKELHASA